MWIPLLEEKKAHGSLTMALTRDIFHSFRGYDSSKDLWKALVKRFEGNSDVKKSKRELLRKQYECFRYFEQESIDELISRFYHLHTELKSYELKYLDDKLVEKFLNALPPKFDISNSHQPRSPTSTPKPALAKIVKDHVALFSSCMLAYENFIGGKLTDPETIEEDFNQVDPYDMEDMDIQWNMAMILRRAKRFLNRTGRKFIGGHSSAKIGFDKSKAKCYKYLNFGHFARECQKDKAPTSAQQDDSYEWGIHLEDAIVAHTHMCLMAEIIEMIKAEERETVAAAEQQGSAFALMAIREASCSSTEVDSNSFIVIPCNNCLKLKGLGTNAIAPPVNGTFVNGAVDIDLSFLDESSSKDNASSAEEFYSDECENNKIDGIVYEDLFNEPKINKNVVNNRDNCILTEPDLIESNDKLKKMLYGDFKTIKQAKKETFANKLGKNFQENIDKNYTQKIQSTSDKTSSVVHQTKSNTSQNKPSTSKTSEPYRRPFKERRNCFHCGMFGHILMNCPYKNQEKWPVVPKQLISLKAPPRKQFKTQVSKTSVQYMVKSNSFTKRRNKDSVVPHVLTFGNTRSYEGQPRGSVSNHWYVDSGYSRHMTGNMALLQDVKPFRGGYVASAGEKGGSITRQGVVTNGCISFDNVNYCEQLKHNLLSVSQMCDKGYSLMFNKSECLVLKPSFVIPEEWILMRATRKNDMYEIDMSVATTISSVVRKIRSDNGTEFKINLMAIFCLKKGIHQEFSAPYTPQQNGVA
ncbi:hypothetical protein L1987_30270 [Smallanthus sonchifolius]|uniref:Uncharacterized protein n=1 Tax=Smallanthus sonchifolius TaxID=185202 RepID=A0ACB9I3J8_9ASTR|nr:hypothetical protein L1987_30270 [Smallanthus sonchifolius]